MDKRVVIMAGHGPAPKPAARRARTNKDPVPSQVLPFQRGKQPPLPSGMDWHPQTKQWWAMWAKSALSNEFTESDWSFLLDTALMHNAMWLKGQWTLAAEVRLRVAKFGATPEDRARLRIVFADADEKDSKRKPAAQNSAARARRGPLQAVPNSG